MDFQFIQFEDPASLEERKTSFEVSFFGITPKEIMAEGAAPHELTLSLSSMFQYKVIFPRTFGLKCLSEVTKRAFIFDHFQNFNFFSKTILYTQCVNCQSLKRSELHNINHKKCSGNIGEMLEISKTEIQCHQFSRVAWTVW